VTNKADRAETESKGTRVHILAANFSNVTLTLPKATVLGIAEPVIEDEIDRINSNTKSGVQSVAKAPRQIRNEGLNDKLLQGKLDHLKEEDRQHIEPVLKRYIHVFHGEVNDFKGSDVIEHEIPVGDARPIIPPYWTP
jgi:hypothetical protein